MTVRQGTKLILIINVMLGIVLLLFSIGLIPWRDYSALPEPSQEWWETVSRLESDTGESVQRLSNKGVFQSRRAGTRILQSVDSLGEYELSGASSNKVYFMNKRNHGLIVCGVGEMIEGYTVKEITDQYVELEKDGNAIQILF
ncbi:MAG: hypothetical protein WCX86_09045 [Candidatus Hydrogenedentales bacterium]|jgi:hypothetical protein